MNDRLPKDTDQTPYTIELLLVYLSISPVHCYDFCIHENNVYSLHLLLVQKPTLLSAAISRNEIEKPGQLFAQV